MLWLVSQIAWFGSAALIFMIDSAARKKKKDVDPEHPDLSDKSVWPWMIVMLVAGGLVLPIYTWSTRKTGVALLVGFGLLAACFVFTLGVRLLAVMLLFSGSYAHQLG